MLDDPHVIESLPAYALGCLTENEATVVGIHLAGCTICRSELSAFQAVTAQLAYSAPAQAVPPAELKRDLLQRVQNLQPSAPPRPAAATRPWRPDRRSLWGAVAALLILALGMSNLLLWQRIDGLEVLTSPHGMRAITLQNTEAAPGASGFVIIGGDGQNGVLVVDEMPLLDPALEYQLWLIRDEETTSGAVFAVDETGYRGVRIRAPESLHAYSAARITIEPAEGSLLPTGEPVMAGLLPEP